MATRKNSFNMKTRHTRNVFDTLSGSWVETGKGASVMPSAYYPAICWLVHIYMKNVPL